MSYRLEPLSKAELAELRRLCDMQSEVLTGLLKLRLDPEPFLKKSIESLRESAREKLREIEKRGDVH